jgi:mannosylglycerate hydrolase
VDKKPQVILYSHTHWDREWYKTFEEFRIELVELIDELLDLLETDPRFVSFCLDGQTVVLEDYLEVRPHNEGRIRELVRAGRLFVGPWYVLPDEYLVSPESLVHNLLLGNLIAERFGRVMPVGYAPDAFGHVSQLPQILAGFGLNSAVFTRGMDSDADRVGTEFLWEAPDGTRVLGVHQWRSYCNGANLGHIARTPGGAPEIDRDAALAKVREEFEALSSVGHTPFVLFCNGCDHLKAQPEIPDTIDYINSRQDDFDVRFGSPEDHIAALGPYEADLPVKSGELHGARLHWILSGVFSARMNLKQENRETEELLSAWVEPWSAVSRAFGGRYDADLIWRAWRLLLQNHPHDSICGCSIDQVHKEMIPRFEQSRQLGRALLKKGLATILDRIDTSGAAAEDAVPIVVFNPHPFAVDSLVDIPEKAVNGRVDLAVFDDKGFRVPSRIAAGGPRCEHCSPAYSAGDPASGLLFEDRSHFAAAQGLPPFGYKTYYIARAPDSAAKEPELAMDAWEIRNEFLSVKIAPNGTLELEDLRSGARFGGLHLLESCDDSGDEYDYSPCPEPERHTTSEAKASTFTSERETGSSAHVALKFDIPFSLSDDRSRRSPAEEMGRQGFVLAAYDLILARGIPRLDIRCRLVNSALDHRLRVLFPTPIRTDHCHAEGHFDVIKRPLKLPEAADWSQRPLPTHHQSTFVSVSDGRVGLSIANRGLSEYEVIEGPEGATVALTLLRCVGWLSRGDLATRPGNAGPSIATPDAQCQGLHVFDYSLIPHRGDWEEACVWQQAHLFASPPRAFVAAAHRGDLSSANSFIEIEAPEVVLSALKWSDRTDGVILRVYNTSTRPVETPLRVALPFKSWRPCDMNEKPTGDPLPLSGGTIEAALDPKRVLTFLLTAE